MAGTYHILCHIAIAFSQYYLPIQTKEDVM